MAPHHCHRTSHHHHPSSSSSCCCSCSTICHCSSTSACHPPPAANDPLLQCLAAHLLQSVHHLPPPQASPPPPQHHHYRYQYDHLPQKHPQPKPYHRRRESETDSPEERAFVDSLIQRIASLESSLTASPPPPRPEASQKGTSASTRGPNRVSLRDVAARTIQIQFRLYLVRRSRTLRHLRDLAIVRSHVADLKSLIPSASVSQRAMDLLLHLDSIQSQDQMIREGKKTIAEELVRILEVSNNRVLAKRRGLSLASKAKTGPLQLEQHSKSSVKSSGVFSGGGDGKVPSSNSSSDFGKEEEEEVTYEGGSSRVSEDDGGVGAEEQEKGGGVSIAGLRNRSNGLVGVGSSSSSSSSLGQQKWVPQLGLYAPLPVQMESKRTELR